MNPQSPGVKTVIFEDVFAPVIDGEITAVFAGDFTRGPIGVFTLISTAKELREKFGKPNDRNFNQWFQAFNYLEYSENPIMINRANSTQHVNASVEAEDRYYYTDGLIRWDRGNLWFDENFPDGLPWR